MEHLQWGLGHQKPSARNPTLNPQEVYRCLVWEPFVRLGKTIETQESEGTLEGSRMFLGMGPHCKFEAASRAAGVPSGTRGQPMGRRRLAGSEAEGAEVGGGAREEGVGGYPEFDVNLGPSGPLQDHEGGGLGGGPLKATPARCILSLSYSVEGRPGG